MQYNKKSEEEPFSDMANTRAAFNLAKTSELKDSAPSLKNCTASFTAVINVLRRAWVDALDSAAADNVVCIRPTYIPHQASQDAQLVDVPDFIQGILHNCHHFIRITGCNIVQICHGHLQQGHVVELLTDQQVSSHDIVGKVLDALAQLLV